MQHVQCNRYNDSTPVFGYNLKGLMGCNTPYVSGSHSFRDLLTFYADVSVGTFNGCIALYSICSICSKATTLPRPFTLRLVMKSTHLIGPPRQRRWSSEQSRLERGGRCGTSVRGNVGSKCCSKVRNHYPTGIWFTQATLIGGYNTTVPPQ